MIVAKGVPYRNCVWKHFVADGPFTSAPKDTVHAPAGVGDKIKLSRLSNVRQDKSFCGERGDAFVVSLRYLDTYQEDNSNDIKTNICRTGFNEMYHALQACTRTTPCNHIPDPNAEIMLPKGCIAAADVLSPIEYTADADVYICLTARNKHARWRALIGIEHIARKLRYERDPRDRTYLPVFLRGQDCCLQCALDQTLAYESRETRFLVL